MITGNMQLRELLRETICALADNGIENARFEAEQLIEKAGIPKIKLISDPLTEIGEEVCEKVNEYCEKRLSGYPLQYILGEWEFCGLPFRVGEGVLIPRQDTETLAELCMEYLRERPGETVLDLCSGSGCIGITLAKLCGAQAVLAELSEEALLYLRENTELNGVQEQCRIVSGNVLDDKLISGEFGVIVSNPPYLTGEDMDRLQKEVSFEPTMALYGGNDGLDFYRKLLPIYTKRLKIGGLFAVEIGINQEQSVMKIFAENGIEPFCEKDMCGIYRVVYGIKQ